MARNRVSDYRQNTTTANSGATSTATSTSATSAAPTQATTTKSTDPVNHTGLHEDIVRSDGYIADATAYNATAPDPHDTECGLIDLPQPGDVIRGKIVYGLTGDWDPDQPGDQNLLNQVDTGARLDVSDNKITWGFYTGQHAVGLNNNPFFGEGKGYTPFTAAQMAAARISIGLWDEVIAPEYEEIKTGPGVKNWAQNKADIWLANTYTGPAQAWAYYPGYGNQYKRVAADVWTADPRYNGTNAQLDPGFYGLQTLNHELGHSLGLSHPGAYNFGDDSDGDGVPDPITYDSSAEFYQDTHQYTVMSYFDSFESGNNQIDWNFMRFVYPSTLMVNDILLVQQIYGKETSTRRTDDTYGFNATAGVTNEAMRFEAGEMATIFTIWDAAGNDTLDLSGYHTPSVIDLREGAYSSAGGWNAYGDAPAADPSTMTKEAYLAYVNSYNKAQRDDGHTVFLDRPAATYDLYFKDNARQARDANNQLMFDKDGKPIYVNEGIPWNKIMGYDYLMENNIGIAYGAVIENAIGGEGNDRINGNQVDNQFTGNGGADTFIIADYSTLPGKTTMDGQTFDDDSVDTIMDFTRAEGDKIDLCELGVSADALSYEAVTVNNVAGTRVTVERGEDDVTFIVLGDTVTATDFIF